MTDTMAPADRPETGDLERRRRPWIWVAVGLAVTGIVAYFATSMLGQSVMYYKTPSEVLAGDNGSAVRLAGELVPGSVKADNGTGVTTFAVKDATSRLTVVYTGSTTTALTTAAQPGAQLVAEGTLGPDGVFHTDKLLAKCPSKFQAAADEGKEHPSDQK